MNSIAEQVAKILLDIKAVSLNRQNPFKYASGILSPIYTDCRLLISYPNERRKIIDFYEEAIKTSGIPVDMVAGTATAGIPHAAWIAERLDLPMVYVRGSAKNHGKGNQIEGKITEGQYAIVIEDLISTGGSSVESVLALRNAGVSVSHVFSIMTYGMQKAVENFQNNNLSLVSLTDFQTVVTTAEKLDYIQKKDQEIILQWAKSPTTWPH